MLSDASTRKLIREFVRAVINAPADGPEHRLGLVVAGPQPHAEQLAKLAGLAAAQMDAPGFFDLVRTPSRFDAGIRGRLDQLEKLVKRALHELGVAEADTALVQQRAWQLLSGLTVLMPRLEAPDETDWSAVKNSLIPVARGSNLTGASRLHDRLVALASEYSPKSAQSRSHAAATCRASRRSTAPSRRHQQGAGRHSTIFIAGRLRRCATRSPRATALAACALIGAMRRRSWSQRRRTRRRSL